jgi:hypothetical protein
MNNLMIALYLTGLFQYFRDRGIGRPKAAVLSQYGRWTMRLTARGIES